MAPSHESLYARLGAPQDQRVDIARAFVGVHRLQVHHVADDMEFVGDAVAPVHVARHAGDVQGGGAGIALDQRDHLGRRSALIEQAAHAQGALQAEADVAHHIRQLELDQLIGCERLAKLMPVQRILPCRMPAELGGAKRAPGDAVARAIQAAERALETTRFWQEASPPARRPRPSQFRPCCWRAS